MTSRSQLKRLSALGAIDGDRLQKLERLAVVNGELRKLEALKGEDFERYGARRYCETHYILESEIDTLLKELGVTSE